MTRYKKVDVGNKAYTIDLDTNKITWIIPWLIWLLPNQVYVESSKQPIEEKEKKPKKGSIILGSSALASVLIRNTDKSFGEIPSLAAYPLLTSFIILGVSIGIFCYRYYFFKKEELSAGDWKSKSSDALLIKLNHRPAKLIIKVLFGVFFMSLILYFFVSIFITKGNILGLGIYCFLLLNIVFRNYYEGVPVSADFSILKK
ncbi:DUF443 family protein [Enterococcus sp. BWR-S5]|uniref:DUF443 family protein n=1 Tax=Enterococcus sp. BWR-S5 TaxID=2787714 RepID=UPI00192501F9|nr:DUF443 family protein [Enterococcus sp. BWR-S5]MBL1225301.1 DUF443 family protein [Enterococcus sp. BWR-S5]